MMHKQVQSTGTVSCILLNKHHFTCFEFRCKSMKKPCRFFYDAVKWCFFFFTTVTLGSWLLLFPPLDGSDTPLRYSASPSTEGKVFPSSSKREEMNNWDHKTWNLIRLFLSGRFLCGLTGVCRRIKGQEERTKLQTLRLTKRWIC